VLFWSGLDLEGEERREDVGGVSGGNQSETMSSLGELKLKQGGSSSVFVDRETHMVYST
jgi:hypothetical protein